MNATKAASKTTAEKRRAAAFSKEAANTAAKALKKVAKLTSFHLGEDLIDALMAFVYSEKNALHQSKTQVVEAAIRAYASKERNHGRYNH